MIMLPSAVRIYLAADGVDLRAGFDRLAIAARAVIKEDPLSGHLFVFLNRRRNMLKALWWDRSGWAILSKRLEEGTFHLPSAPPVGARHIQLDAAQFALMLEGLDLSNAKQHKRYVRLPKASNKSSPCR